MDIIEFGVKIWAISQIIGGAAAIIALIAIAIIFIRDRVRRK